MPNNIEKSAFRQGQYVGYTAVGVYRIYKIGAEWWANHQHGSAHDRPAIGPCRTLAEVGKQLETL